MPLEFPSSSHGRVVFGFYNVETDGLLLNDRFFFCTDFCVAAGTLAAGQAAAPMPGYRLADRAAIGDLMGAIHGTRLDGYLGDIYRLWPFPNDPAEFRQRLAGSTNRATAEALLRRHGKAAPIPVGRGVDGTFTIGPFAFDEDRFRALLAYVRRGGHPTWEGFEDGRCPPQVRHMAQVWGLEEEMPGPVPLPGSAAYGRSG